MLVWPDWNKLYAKGQCLYFGVAFSDAQWAEINNAKTESEKNEIIRKFREEYLKNKDLLWGDIMNPEVKKEEAKVEEPAPVEDIELPDEKEEISIEKVKPAKTKKGK